MSHRSQFLLLVTPCLANCVAMFFAFAQRARARDWKVVTMEADHSPEMSRPQALLPLLLLR